MAGPLILSIFPGIDLLGRAFEEEWPEACVVRGPDLIFGGDIRAFHPPAGKFDGVIGGPPCQLFSRLKRLNPRAGEKHGNLIPEFERVVAEAAAAWFLMENVPEAPEPSVAGYVVKREVLRDVWVGGATMRERAFAFGSRDGGSFCVDVLALHATDAEPAVCADARVVPVAMLSGGRVKRRISKPGVSRVGPVYGPRLSIVEMLRRQGAPAELLDEAPFTDSGKRQAIGNGVPMALGRAIAKAVRQAVAR